MLSGHVRRDERVYLERSEIGRRKKGNWVPASTVRGLDLKSAIDRLWLPSLAVHRFILPTSHSSGSLQISNIHPSNNFAPTQPLIKDRQLSLSSWMMSDGHPSQPSQSASETEQPPTVPLFGARVQQRKPHQVKYSKGKFQTQREKKRNQNYANLC